MFRKQVVQMHREIFRRNQRRINASVSGYTAAFRRYERQYSRFVESYERRARVDELLRAIARASLAYVGDYHTLPQAQRSFLRLLRRIPDDRPVTLALEFVQGRHQTAVDRYLAGDLGDAAFLDAIDHTAHWVFSGWASFRPIFEHARERGWKIIGIDAVGRGPAGTSLTARDRYAARRIAAVRRERPEDLVLVLIGELHIAPVHLPARVAEAERRDARQGRGPGEGRRVIVYQNCEEIYWQLEARGLEHEVELVRVAVDQYCVMNTPPIVCQQSFLNWLSVDDDSAQLEAPEENFKEYVQLIASFFELPIDDAVEEVEVATVVDLSFLQRLQRRGDFSPADMEKIRAQILRSESYYIPSAHTVYLGNLSVNHASEEATHYIRHVCADADEPRMLVDAFYARALEEALGFLGSKIINHKRKAPHPEYFKRVRRRRSTPTDERELARLVLKHDRMMRGERVRAMSEVYECDAETFNAVTHIIGYQLGDRLYYALIGGQLSKDDVRQLFFEPFEEEGEALTTFLHLSLLTRDVEIPERF